jgi:hypothetical protein
MKANMWGTKLGSEKGEKGTQQINEEVLPSRDPALRPKNHWTEKFIVPLKWSWGLVSPAQSD